MTHIRDEQSVTMQDIADHCGVAKITVSYALRGGPRPVSKATRERILAAADALGYNPALHHAARRLALQKSGQTVLNHVVAAFFPTTMLPGDYFSRIFHSVLNTLASANFAMFSLVSAAPDASAAGMPVFERGNVDGALVVIVGDEGQRLCDTLRAIPGFGTRPLVSLLNPLPGCAGVVADDWSGAYAAAAHLLDARHRHLLHFYNTSFNFPLLQRRVSAFRQAYHDRALSPDTYLHYFDYNTADNDDEQRLYQQRLQQYLSQTPEITAILPRNDYQVSYLVNALHGMGLCVPEDISIIGFDDTYALLDAQGTNILTTVRVPLEDLGRQAALLMIDLLTAQSTSSEQIVLPTELIVRGSVAPPRQRQLITP